MRQECFQPKVRIRFLVSVRYWLDPMLVGKGYTLCRVISIRIAASTVKDLVGWVKYRSRCQSLEESNILEYVMFA